MSEYFENINEEFSEDFWSALCALKDREEFQVPADYFKQSESVLLLRFQLLTRGSELQTPEGYFHDSEERVLSEIEAQQDDLVPFFSSQEEQIMSQIKLLPLMAKEEFNVPQGFFENQELSIQSKLKKQSASKVIVMNWKALSYVAAAAVAAVALVVFWPSSNRPDQSSFAELLNKTELEIEDLEYFATEDEYYELFMDVSEEEVNDTLVQDTITHISGDLPDQGQMSGDQLKLDPKTGLPFKLNKNGIKPLESDQTLTWDDITEEDLFEYLKEEGDDEILQDF